MPVFQPTPPEPQPTPPGSFRGSFHLNLHEVHWFWGSSIIIAGAVGLMLASAILMPGQRTRASALKTKAKEALVLELGVMFMLIVAGFIEGFVSPSSIPYFSRITIMGLSFVIWLLYFGFAGRFGGVGIVVPKGATSLIPTRCLQERQ